MSQGQQARTRPAPAWPKDTLRIAFGVIWLIDASLKWLPGFRSSYMSVIMGEAQGQRSTGRGMLVLMCQDRWHYPPRVYPGDSGPVTEQASSRRGWSG